MRPPVKGPGAPARVDEGLFIPVHGLDQWITIRGEDRSNPVLFIISGPGAPLSRAAPMFMAWERDVTLVQWDQPGAGATFARNPKTQRGLTLDRLVRYAAAAIEQVRARLGVAKVAVLGLSGGSVVGLMLAHARPDLVFAYIGSGQFVDYARQDALSYAAVLDQARAAGDMAAVADLEALGSPPWPDAASDAVVSKHSGALTPAEQASLTPELLAALRNPAADAAYIARGLTEHDPRAVAMAAYAALRDELKAFDARRLALRFDAPILFIQGDRDLYSVTSAVEAYADGIAAPRKDLALVEGGGHSCFRMGEAFLAPLRAFLKNAPA